MPFFFLHIMVFIHVRFDRPDDPTRSIDRIDKTDFRFVVVVFLALSSCPRPRPAPPRAVLRSVCTSLGTLHVSLSLSLRQPPSPILEGEVFTTNRTAASEDYGKPPSDGSARHRWAGWSLIGHRQSFTSRYDTKRPLFIMSAAMAMARMAPRARAWCVSALCESRAERGRVLCGGGRPRNVVCHLHYIASIHPTHPIREATWECPRDAPPPHSYSFLFFSFFYTYLYTCLPAYFPILWRVVRSCILVFVFWLIM